MIIVTLTEAEKAFAISIAKARNAEQRNANQSDGNVISSLKADIQGSYGELAVSKALGLTWDGKFFSHDKWKDWRKFGNDVSKLEVRTTIHPTGRLILHLSDKDDVPYILVVLNKLKQQCELVGWVYGRDGKNQQWWEDVGYGRPCFYVPRDQLKSISLLNLPCSGE